MEKSVWKLYWGSTKFYSGVYNFWLGSGTEKLPLLKLLLKCSVLKQFLPNSQCKVLWRRLYWGSAKFCHVPDNFFLLWTPINVLNLISSDEFDRNIGETLRVKKVRDRKFSSDPLEIKMTWQTHHIFILNKKSESAECLGTWFFDFRIFLSLKFEFSCLYFHNWLI